MTPERWAWVEVDLAAIRANVGWLREVAAPADIWAVVKANGYGHGAVPVARAALDAGAAGLAVALVDEGAQLRAAGIERAEVLVLAEPPPEWMPLVVAHQLQPMVYSIAGIEAAAVAAEAAGGAPLPVHLKIDTGMHRVGASPDDAVTLARRIVGHRSLRLAAVATHLAVADEVHHPATPAQLARFDAVLDGLAEAGVEVPAVHVANSAGTLLHGSARRTFTRTGISIYGIAPSPALAATVAGPLRPALSLKAKVSFVKRVDAGDQVSYGLRHTFATATTVATLPLGYADGVPRRLFETGGEVLLAGHRCPIVGVVTMDQLMVDAGPAEAAGHRTEVGDEAVLLGGQGEQHIGADEWAVRLGTISYEIVCGLSGRLPRRYEQARGPAGDGR